MVRVDWRASAAPYWVRHPHVVGAVTFVVVVGASVLLTGCECGVGWPCPK